ncbi:MAG: stage III sporulation protein AF [Hungatella sp.]|nr:stage III sporulation protein AF [Hungatella sp.]
MKEVLNWAGNILFFLVFLTVLENLLPNKKYGRYIRLFTGLVLILLIVQPVARGLNLEERLASSFEAITFQQQADDLSREIMGIEQQRLQQIMGSYEEAVESDLNAMAEEMGYVSKGAHVVIEKNVDSQAYGSVVRIEMEVMERREGKEEQDDAVQAVNPVELVTIKVTEEETAEGISKETREETKSLSELSQEGTLNQLKRKVETYYGLETGEVEIKVQRQ